MGDIPCPARGRRVRQPQHACKQPVKWASTLEPPGPHVSDRKQSRRTGGPTSATRTERGKEDRSIHSRLHVLGYVAFFSFWLYIARRNRSMSSMVWRLQRTYSTMDAGVRSKLLIVYMPGRGSIDQKTGSIDPTGYTRILVVAN